MPAFCINRFRPFVEHLEAREVPSADLGSTLALPTSATALVQQFQTSGTQVNYDNLINTLANSLAAGPKGTVVNGVVDVTQQVKSAFETDLLSKLPGTLGNYPLIGEVKLDRVTLNRLTLDKAGNFNGQLDLTFKYMGSQSAVINATITNNQVALDSGNMLVKQFGKLEQRQKDVQPYVAAALNQLRTVLMPQYFGTATAN